MDPESNIPGVLTKRGRGGTDTHTGANQMKMEAEAGVTQQKASSTGDCQQAPSSQEGPGEAWRGPHTSEGSQPDNTLISDFQPSRRHEFFFLILFKLIFIAIQSLYHTVLVSTAPAQ